MGGLFTSGLIRLHGQDIARLQRILDPLVITSLFILFERKHWWYSTFAYIPAWVLVALSTIVLLSRAGLYSSFRRCSLRVLVRRICSSWILLLGLLLFVVYIDKNTASFSRVATTTWAVSGFLWLLTSHVFSRKLLRWYRSHGGNRRTIVYWGEPAAALAFARQLNHNSWMGLRIVAWFTPGLVCDWPESVKDLPPPMGGASAMREWLNQNPVDMIVFSHTNRPGVSIEGMLQMFGDTATPVIYAPKWAHESMRFQLDSMGDQPVIQLWGQERALSDLQAKRAFDLILTSFGVLIISPLLALIAIAVKLSSPGPILYAQDRYGLDGKRFKCFKFRSMFVLDSDEQVEVRQATAFDPRVTLVGRFLRRWSLDELPQIFNVLIGDMSLVGPRPHAVQHNELYRKVIPGYMQRHAFKPGITGLAQVSGWRGETRNLAEMEQRIHADLRYQRDWSLKLDVKILIKTFLCLRSGNAY